jgi:hypothetical protein
MQMEEHQTTDSFLYPAMGFFTSWSDVRY